MLKVQIQEQIAILSLDRPDKRNAMTPEMLTMLDAEIKNCASSVRALVILGEGKTFCAGFDLKQCADDPSGGTMRQLLTGLSTVVRTMRAIEIPIILGVHGAAVAGGCAILGGADIVVADEHAKLGYPVVKIGVSPAVSAAFMIASFSLGAVRARLVDTELISGLEAQRIGLVHETVPNRDDVRCRCIEIAEELASKPGIACGATKAWLNEIVEPMTNNAQRGLETSLSLTGTPEEQERLAALWG